MTILDLFDKPDKEAQMIFDKVMAEVKEQERKDREANPLKYIYDEEVSCHWRTGVPYSRSLAKLGIRVVDFAVPKGDVYFISKHNKICKGEDCVDVSVNSGRRFIIERA
jgi:hypothetical protein